jgi:dienelactone hydrolase
MLPFRLSFVLTCLAWSALAGAQPFELPYTLAKPAGDGPFPAVVILHDCSGLGPRSSGAPWRWSSELTRRGYVTMWPDSFTTRGYPTGVCTEVARPRVTPVERARDAYAALRFLSGLPYVDAKRVAVMGGSHGGSSTLATIVDSASNATERRFAAAVALYPGCGAPFGAWSVRRANEPGRPIVEYSGVFKPRTPLLILIGALDDWTPAEPCQRLAAAAKAAGYPVEIKVYPGAHHSFDSLAPVRFVPNRRNINAASGRGATTGGNADAWADAIGQVDAFLARHLAPAGPAPAQP